MNRVFEAIEKACLVLTCITLALMSIVLVFQVFMRYVMNNATSWSDEVATLLFVWTVMLAIPVAIRRNEHIGVQFLVNRIPSEQRRWAHAIQASITLLVLALIGVFAFGIMGSANRQVLAGTTLALGHEFTQLWMAMAIPVGCFIGALFSAERVYLDILNKPQWEVRNPSEIEEIFQGGQEPDSEIHFADQSPTSESNRG